MEFTKIHSAHDGETHFMIEQVPERELAVGPPPNPVGQMCDLGSVSSMSIVAFPAGTQAPAHNAPLPYIVIVLSGEGEVVTSDGQSKRFHPGELLVCNDLSGKGHVTRAITDMKLAFINRSQS